jgi:hypothetical protein
MALFIGVKLSLPLEKTGAVPGKISVIMVNNLTIKSFFIV